MSYRLARTTLAVALSSSLLLLSVGAGMSVAASPTTPVKPSIQGGGPGGGGDDANEGNEGAEHASGRVEGKGHKDGGKKRGTHIEGNEGTGTGGGLVNKAVPSANLKQGATSKVLPKVTPKVTPKVIVKKPAAKRIVKPTAKTSAKPKVAAA